MRWSVAGALLVLVSLFAVGGAEGASPDEHESANPRGQEGAGDPNSAGSEVSEGQPSAGPAVPEELSSADSGGIPFGNRVSPGTLINGTRGPQRCRGDLRIITDVRPLNALVQPTWPSQGIDVPPSYEDHEREVQGWNEGIEIMREEAAQAEESRIRQGGLDFVRAGSDVGPAGSLPTPEALSRSLLRLRRRLLAPRVVATPPPTPGHPPRRRSKWRKWRAQHPAELLVGAARVWGMTASEPGKKRLLEFTKGMPSFDEAHRMGFEAPRRRDRMEIEWGRVVQASAILMETDAITSYYKTPATLTPPSPQQVRLGLVGASSDEKLVTQAYLFLDGRGRPSRVPAPPPPPPPPLPLPPLNPPPPSPTPGGKGGKGRGDRQGDAEAPSAGPAPKAPPPGPVAQPADQTAELPTGPATGPLVDQTPILPAAPPAEPVVIEQPPSTALPGVWGGGLNLLMPGGSSAHPGEVWVQSGMTANGTQQLVQVVRPNDGWGEPDPNFVGRWAEGEGPEPWAEPTDESPRGDADDQLE